MVVRSTGMGGDRARKAGRSILPLWAPTVPFSPTGNACPLLGLVHEGR